MFDLCLFILSSKHPLADTVVPACQKCGISPKKSHSRLPSGWKRCRAEVFCARCWKELYLPRTVVIPIASPMDCSWDEVNELLQRIWILTTRAANWFVTQFYVRDNRRVDGAPLPRMSDVYLYPEARAEFPELPSRTIAALEQSLKRKYKSLRYDLLWRRSTTLPTFRYPMPFPVPAQAWTFEIENNVPVLAVGLGERRLRFRLRSGDRYRRQIEILGRLDRQAAVPGELTIYKRDRETMCAFVVWIRRASAPNERNGVLVFRTSKDSLIVLISGGELRWSYHGDHVRRWQAEHQSRLRRWKQDERSEAGLAPPLAQRKAEAVAKHRRRMQTACHTIASILVKRALREKVETLCYDDSDRGFCVEFPWFDLKLKIRQKCEASGLNFDEAHSSCASQRATGQAQCA